MKSSFTTVESPCTSYELAIDGAWRRGLVVVVVCGSFVDQDGRPAAPQLDKGLVVPALGAAQDEQFGEFGLRPHERHGGHYGRLVFAAERGHDRLERRDIDGGLRLRKCTV